MWSLALAVWVSASHAARVVVVTMYPNCLLTSLVGPLTSSKLWSLCPLRIGSQRSSASWSWINSLRTAEAAGLHVIRLG